MAASERWARVDDRLIHGQVTVAWRRYLGYEAIWIVDDGLGEDPFMVETLRLTAPQGVAVEVHTISAAADALQARAPERLLLLFEQPQVALRLVEAGIALPQLVVGNLAPSPGSRRVMRSIALNAAQAAALDALAARGVHVVLQPTPDDPAREWTSVRRRWA
jgi:mannose/fructose/N-acetylgalactosamine-specific phosphotransferase system component IIB